MGKREQQQTETDALEEKMAVERAKAMEYAEKRVQEVARDKARKEVLFEKELRVAPASDKSTLISQQQAELKGLDDAMKRERKNQLDAVDKKMQRVRNQLHQKQSKREMAIQDRKMDGKTKIAKIKANIDDVMKSSE